MDSRRSSGGRPNQRSSGGSYRNSGGGYGNGGRRSGSYGSGGGGGFRSPRDPPPEAFFKLAHPDPYKLPLDRKNLNDLKWKALAEYQDEVVLHQKNLKDEGTWNKNEITVSVNHYLIESLDNRRAFPLPTFYHYNIAYDVERPRPRPPLVALNINQHAPLSNLNGPGIGSASKTTLRGKRKKDDENEVVEVIEAKLRNNLPTPPRLSPVQPQKSVLPKHLTSIVLDYLIPNLRQQYNHFAIAADGVANLYTTKKLEDIGIPKRHQVTFEDLRNAGLSDECDEGIIKITIRPALNSHGEPAIIDTSLLAKNFASGYSSLQGVQIAPELRQTLEAAFNAFVKCMPNFAYYAVGRSTMVPRVGAEEKLLGNGLVARKGFSASINMGWKPYLNADIANCAFIVGRPVLEVLKDVVRDPQDASRWSHRDFNEARSLLKTCKVSYTVGNQKRSGPIRDILKKTPTTQKFRWEEKKKEVNVLTYYKERYGVVLKYPHAPLLELRQKGVYIPSELCTVKDGQSYNRKLDGDQTTNMIDFARKRPDESHAAIQQMMTDMELENNPILKSLGVKMSSQMVKMQARVLVPPTIRYGGKTDQPDQIAHVSPTDGTWDCWRKSNYNFYESATIKKWGILTVGCTRYREKDDSVLRDFAHSLKNNGAKKGVKFECKPWPVIVDRKDRRYTSANDNVRDLVDYFRNDFRGCDIIICVIPRKGDPVYGHIKHAAEVEVGVLTQCVAERNVSSAKDSTVQNILLKMNTKLGGVNSVTVPPFDKTLASQYSTVLTDYPVLVLGADVTHAPPGSRTVLEDGSEFVMPSYAAVTGSLDRTGMPYMTEVRAQRKPNAGAAEVIEHHHLVDIVKKMLNCYIQNCGLHPAKIIYFRDGVGEGQFPEVLHVEMNAIRDACHLIKPGYEPKITFITVQKRHKTRIFHHGKNGIENAPAGTVIDKEIVHSTEIDFYLLSHKGLMGTSRPSRYHVLWDDSDFSQNELESIAFTLCFMYARCTKSVKLPAPTYYAHLAAERAKKLCEGFETRYGSPSEENLNKMLMRNHKFTCQYPMHFV